jgi:hypothetical protein
VNEPGDDERGLVVERRILALAHQVSELINAERPEEREILREIAVNALRDEVRVAATLASVQEREGTGGNFNPFGIAIPLALAGALLVALFPPLGLALFIGAGVMVVWGVIVTLFVRS